MPRWALEIDWHTEVTKRNSFATLWHTNEVFSRVCLSTGGPHVTITHDALDLTVSPLPALVLILIPPPDIWHGDSPGPVPLRHGTWGPLHAGPSASDIWRPSLEICSNLFIGPHCTAPPPLILTSGDHWGTYNCQADSTHPTGMLPCLWY